MVTNEITDAINYLSSLRITDVLDGYRTLRDSSVKGNAIFYYCPFHDDRHTANLSVNMRSNYCKCFRGGCGFGGGPVKAMICLEKNNPRAKMYGREFVEFIKQMVVKWKGTPVESYYKETESSSKKRPDLNITHDDIMDWSANLDTVNLEYLSHRGITNPHLYRIGGKLHWGVPHVVIPTYYNGKLVAVKYRRNDLVSTGGKRFYSVPGSNTSFPFVLASSEDDTLFVTEDSFSAISVREMGWPVISLASGNTIQDEGKEEFQKVLEGRNLIVIPDKGDSGSKLLEDLEALNFRIKKVIYVPEEGCKDMNDLLQLDRYKAASFLFDNWEV